MAEFLNYPGFLTMMEEIETRNIEYVYIENINCIVIISKLGRF